MSYIGNTSTQQSFTPTVDYFSGNNSTVAFTLSRPVASVAQIEVVIDNVAQNPSTAYTVSGNTITFTSAPLTGTNNIYVRYTSPITQVIAPGQGTVGATQIDTAYALWNKSGSNITYTAGNVGIGVTPSAWSGYTALQIGARASLATTGAATSVVQNAYNNGTNWIYLANSYASRYNQVSGQHEWYYAASGTAGNTATFTQAMTLDSSGNLSIGTTSISGGRLTVKAATSSGANAMQVKDSADTVRMELSDNGYIRFPAVYGTFTSAAAANVYMYTDGGLYRSTSSLKYKKNVVDATHGLADLLNLRPVTYEGKAEMDSGKTFGGLIAEEVHDAGLTEFVQYAEDGSPDALAYGNMVSLCVKAIQELKAINDTQAETINALTARIEALEGR